MRKKKKTRLWTFLFKCSLFMIYTYKLFFLQILRKPLYLCTIQCRKNMYTLMFHFLPVLIFPEDFWWQRKLHNGPVQRSFLFEIDVSDIVASLHKTVGWKTENKFCWQVWKQIDSLCHLTRSRASNQCKPFCNHIPVCSFEAAHTMGSRLWIHFACALTLV